MLIQSTLEIENDYDSFIDIGDVFEFSLVSIMDIALLNDILINEQSQLIKCRSDTIFKITTVLSNISPNKKKNLRINFYKSKYEIVRKVAMDFGFQEVEEMANWTVQWTDCIIGIQKILALKKNQKLNHFPGMVEICRKDNLGRNINRMKRLYCNEFNFLPRTWILPNDIVDIRVYFKKHPNKTFILKPEASCRGRGIFLSKNINEISASEQMVCQEYVKPFLIDGYKFDLRLYVLVISVDPLRIYMYKEGLVRFTTIKYEEPSEKNIGNLFMHLTNYSVQKDSDSFIHDDEEEGTKRRVTWLNKWLRRNNYDVEKIWNSIDDVVIKTIVTIQDDLRKNYRNYFARPPINKPTRLREISPVTSACFELLGFDILINRQMKPMLMEVNHSPSLHTDAGIDFEVKHSLLWDTFQILNLRNISSKFSEQSRKPYNIKSYKKKPKKLTKSPYMDMLKSELSLKGRYRLIYPNPPSTNVYTKYISNSQYSSNGDFIPSDKKRMKFNNEFSRQKIPHEAQLSVPKKPRFFVISKDRFMNFNDDIRLAKNEPISMRFIKKYSKQFMNQMGSAGDVKQKDSYENDPSAKSENKSEMSKSYTIKYTNDLNPSAKYENRSEMSKSYTIEYTSDLNNSVKNQFINKTNKEEPKESYDKLNHESHVVRVIVQKNHCSNISSARHNVVYRQTTQLKTNSVNLTRLQQSCLI